VSAGSRVACLLALLVAACGGATARSTVELAPFFEAEGIAGARREAPDLIAAAELAREEAERANASGDTDAAHDHATRARLLLDAALAEADRVRFDRERLALLDEAEAALTEARSLELAREALAAQARRDAAAEIARAQMQNAHAAAERLESRGRRHRGPDVDRTRREAASALEVRTRLSIAAARALGASDEDLAPLEIERARPSDPAEWLAQADEAHRRALALLGRLRATHPVGAETVASLVDAARERALVPVSTPEGLVLADPSDRALLDLARAFPHGLVVLRGRGASARQRRLAPELPDRLGVDETEADPTVVFTAYATVSASGSSETRPSPPAPSSASRKTSAQ
jgi:hypothetical protein